ncbi:50S ribosomal protein L6 [Salinibacter ruber]|jgi:large subunit ribosomal protein L6|uniref:Large ribosomal subunit protein uL6 n=3 Tax=Salinibacter ruber TaxID=146919 RepID=RL6_SALRD|nr:50S ribosomal protein L6 [Salinibacter ruber]Q2S3P9.1 RecName: Full=Large ribosomal subunit protein uL6; AltName: Full=50S ribosomal protein L6 [Salinibacter ruber DSM 13855]ABC44671.1 ribosomal protein L6 [Salinibacter ruber DSM 13855]MBB4060862.1 large subunit ribosomal protein L6 [Salinibacter ruber]MBB4070485.1 large subunit ribosomal protein L6 [Salinibacter ruber]MCS3612239.1 large subunit ribosomal protein L6 [Salinibacter ruber]MCS3615295.1 large subunit ribosomal protein L6 [Salin
MARIGDNPIPFGDEVTVSVDDHNVVTIEGPKGTLTEQIDPEMTLDIADDHVVVRRPTNQKRHRSLHGLSRSLIVNMVEGVTEGYKKELKIIGVGYRAQMSDETLEIALGYSHPIYFLPPSDVAVSVDSDRGQDDIIIVEGIDKELVGQVAAKIRSLRPPEPYKGKGVRYVDEHVPLKAGKTAAR